MTFDARSAPGEKKGGQNNMMFGAAVVCIVAGAFFFTLKSGSPEAPKIAEAAPKQVITAVKVEAPIEVALNTDEAQAYFDVLRAVDNKAHTALMKRLNKAEQKPLSAQYDIVYNHARKVLKSHSDDLARAPAMHVDALLTSTQTRLKQAARSGSAWCFGSQYVEALSGDFAKADALREQLVDADTSMQAYSLEMLAMMMQAVIDGRDTPEEHGPVTPIDLAALDGVIISLGSVPQIQQIQMAPFTGADPEPMIAALNVCEIAASAIIAAKTLPQDTKGRFWAHIVNEAELGGADLRQLNGLAGL